MRSTIACILLVFLTACQTPIVMLREVKHLPAYPSASGIEYYNDHFYIIGDDATCLLQLDSTLAIAGSIPLYASTEKRIPKQRKADLEAITLVTWKKRPHLLLTGSGSTDSLRNTAWLIDVATKEKTLFHLDAFYTLLKNAGLNELNLEGSCSIPGFIVLSNRGNQAFPKNQLVFTSPDFWLHQQSAPVKIVKVGVNDDSAVFKGISGMAYATRSDKLLLTVSTENTTNAYEDGAIGKSYLWVIDNISSKRRLTAINPTRVIDLAAMDPRFEGQKIESVCVVKETKRFMRLGLVADNDDGESVVFLVEVSK